MLYYYVIVFILFTLVFIIDKYYVLVYGISILYIFLLLLFLITWIGPKGPNTR